MCILFSYLIAASLCSWTDQPLIGARCSLPWSKPDIDLTVGEFCGKFTKIVFQKGNEIFRQESQCQCCTGEMKTVSPVSPGETLNRQK